MLIMQPFQGVRGMGLCGWLFVAFAIIGTSECTLSGSDKEAITKGFEAGEKILDFIKSREFTKTLTKLATSLGPFLGALGPFVSIILAFIPGQESAELTFMKTMMKKIDNRFDQVDQRFDEIERLIDWNKVAVNFGQIEQRILAVEEDYKYLYSSSAPVQAKQQFILRFENGFQNSAVKLYHAMINKNGVFQENLGRSVMRYTENDRKKTQAFLLGILRLLLNAVKLELAYYAAKGYTIVTAEKKTIWEGQIRRVSDIVKQIDTLVMYEYREQSRKDLDKLIADNYGVSNKDFLGKANGMLTQKYFWLDWFVVVYNAVTGFHNHCVRNCGGHFIFRQGGRNVVVAAVDKTSTRMNKAIATAKLNSVGNRPYLTSDRDAKPAWQKINYSGACGVIVIRRSADPYFTRDRIVHRSTDMLHLILFG